jgi:hypothetical protein
LNEPNTAEVKAGPPRRAMALVVVTLALLAMFVWYLNPRQPNLKPAPLKPNTAECRKPGREFVPSNLIEIPEPELSALSQNQKDRATFRLNMTPCTCGCQLSVIACRASNPKCVNSSQMLKDIIREEAKKPEQTTQQK